MALLPTDSGTLAALLVNIETIKFQLAKAEREGPIDPLRTRDPERDLAGALKLVPTRNSEKWHPVLVIHQVMLRCGDEAAHEASAEFRFVQDPDVRQELLTDLNTARSALRNAEWKPATVIAGALAEALLLWAVDQHQSAEITQAIGHVERPIPQNSPSARIQRRPFVRRKESSPVARSVEVCVLLTCLRLAVQDASQRSTEDVGLSLR
jgi:hypothetical protein